MNERRMGLGELADAIAPQRIVGLPVGEVRGLAYDSRSVQAGELFFAVPGVHVDGLDFVPQAVERGAVAVVVERELAPLTVPQLVVEGARRALADAADAWFGRPSEHLEVIGVTGTDGKTTTAFMSEAVLRAGGRRPGLIGTVALHVGDEERANEARNTTPEALELQALLAEMVAAGNDAVVIEATSHGLAQERVRNCRFRVGMLTTVTSEHLEFHGTLEAYWAAKARLIEEAPLAVLNADDGAYDYMRARARGEVLTYGIDAAVTMRASDLAEGPVGTSFIVHGPRWSGPVSVALPGRFNVYNALAALTLAEAEGLDPAVAARAVGQMGGVPGRMERVDLGQPFGVVVDYAHTADSLEKVLRVLRPITAARLIVVFGSAGERDRTKRPAMGAVAGRLADIVIVTDEDPRLEEPHAINEEIAEGARQAGCARLEVIDDRRAAIRRAIETARDGDMILLAGKGHEQSMIYGTQRRPWDDREVARQQLRAAGYGGSHE
jgi:UDP-N-acetylmuramoyl-L-alanyl-D-glutamate--2,6-diaminopimelate ligase